MNGWATAVFYDLAAATAEALDLGRQHLDLAVAFTVAVLVLLAVA